MSDSLDGIAAALKTSMAEWLEEPNAAFLSLQELEERLEALGGVIGPRAKEQTLKALSGSKQSIRATRQREAADAIAVACREIGIILEAKPPLKRRPRRRRSEASTPTSSGMHTDCTEQGLDRGED